MLVVHPKHTAFLSASPAEKVYDNRLNLAAADNAYHLALGTAGRAQWQAQVGADATRAVLLASQLLGNVAASVPDANSIEAPTALIPPTPDTGSVTIVTGNDYWVIQPGAVHPGWYYDNTIGWWAYIVGSNIFYYFDWAHGGEPWSSTDYYWNDWGAWGEGWIGWGQYGPFGYQSTWDYREFVAPYAGYTQDPFQFYYASGWHDAQFSVYHGGWDYNPSAPGDADGKDLFRPLRLGKLVRRGDPTAPQRPVSLSPLLAASFLPPLFRPQRKRFADLDRCRPADLLFQLLDPAPSLLQRALQCHHEVNQPIGIDPALANILLESLNIVHAQPITHPEFSRSASCHSLDSYLEMSRRRNRCTKYPPILQNCFPASRMPTPVTRSMAS